jgi:SAM-dependent methyltransferase
LTESAAARVHFRSPRGRITFDDSVEHFHDALLRLLNLDEAAFLEWIERSDRFDGELLQQLASGWRELRPLSSPMTERDSRVDCPDPWGGPGTVLYSTIAESGEHGIAVSADGTTGWLIDWRDGRAERVMDPPRYEEEYFEGDVATAGGYGSYLEQSRWRLEKAARQVREMRAATNSTSGRVLDVGSGYGFFRVALEKAGYEHEGVEISEHARRVAREQYGFTTFAGELGDHWAGWAERYDVITGFDFIEHAADVDTLLEQILHCLEPGGCLGLKTPNLRCPEADLFGAHYHSFKREHIWYFTPESLTAAAVRAGFEPIEVSTTSHLLVGFVGRVVTESWARDGAGADITAWFRKPAARA